MCTSIFCESPLSSLTLLISSLGFLVTSSSLHLENFLRSFVLEAPAVGSNFLENFIHASLASLCVFAFVFNSLLIRKYTVSYCLSIRSL